MITIGSLFSGLGAFELGLERAMPSARTLWQVEINPFARRILGKHWPHAQRHEDIHAVGAHNLAAVDVICGGFPCQDISVAGKGAGIFGERSGLFFQLLRVVRETRPRIVVMENSPALLSRGLSVVLGELAKSGYDAVWDVLSAEACGAPHLRERIYIVAADADRHQLREQPKRQRGSDMPHVARTTRFTRALADANMQQQHLPALGGFCVSEPPWVGFGASADPQREGLEGPTGSGGDREGRATVEPARVRRTDAHADVDDGRDEGRPDWAHPRDKGIPHEASPNSDGAPVSFDRCAVGVAASRAVTDLSRRGGAGWHPASAVRRMDDGLAEGVDRPRRRRPVNDKHRLHALGNAVVVQVAEVVGRVVAEILAEPR